MTRLLYRCDVQRNVAQPGRNRLNHPVKVLTTVFSRIPCSYPDEFQPSSGQFGEALPRITDTSLFRMRVRKDATVVQGDRISLVEGRDTVDIFEDLDVLLVARRRTHRELLLRRIDTADVAQGVS